MEGLNPLCARLRRCGMEGLNPLCARLRRCVALLKRVYRIPKLKSPSMRKFCPPKVTQCTPTKPCGRSGYRFRQLFSGRHVGDAIRYSRRDREKRCIRPTDVMPAGHAVAPRHNASASCRRTANLIRGSQRAAASHALLKAGAVQLFGSYPSCADSLIVSLSIYWGPSRAVSNQRTPRAILTSLLAEDGPS